MPFYGSGYTINNNFNIGIIELDTRVSNSQSNKLTVGYSALRDFRNFLGKGSLPMVDIGNGTMLPMVLKLQVLLQQQPALALNYILQVTC